MSIFVEKCRNFGAKSCPKAYSIQYMDHLNEFMERLARRFLAVPAVICFGAVALSYLLSSPIGAVIMLSLCIALLIAIGNGRGEKARQCMLFTVGVLIVITISLFLAQGTESVEDGSVSEFDAKVISVERTLDGRSSVTIKSREYGKLRLTIFENDPYVPEPGSVVYIKGRLSYPESPRNPGEFDSGAYLRRLGIRYDLKVLSISEVRDAAPFWQAIARFDMFMFDIRDKTTDLFGDQKPLAAAIFLGDTSLTTKDVSSLFRRMGCSHLLAVSGTHFSGFLMLVAILTEGKGRKKTRDKVIFVLFCIVLGSFTGWSKSVTRSAIMSSATCCSKDSLSGMCLAALIMMIADPYSALSYGFLMSFMSCFAILLISPKLNYRLWRLGLSKETAQTVGVILSAQLGMLPFGCVTSLRYGIMPFAVQMVSTFIAQTACIFFVPSVILGFVCGDAFAAPAKLMLIALIKLMNTVAPVYSAFKLPRAIGIAILACVAYGLTPKSRLRERLVLPLVAILALACGSALAAVLNPVRTRVIFIDVGQGDSCLILSGGKSLLIDGGTYQAGCDHVSPVLDYYGVDQVDVAIATHLDEDHSGGIRYLYETGRIRQVVTSHAEGDMQEVQGGDEIRVSDDCTVTVISPTPDEYTWDSNEDCVVCLVETCGVSILMTGDIGAPTESALVRAGRVPDVDILKVAHHGSAYSTSDVFLDACRPEIAVISVGEQNEYGHPAPDTVGRITEHGSAIYMTSRTGAIILSFTDGGTDTEFYAYQ